MANRYTSENFWSLQRFEEYYANDKITSKKIGDAFRSLNRQYSRLTSNTPKKNGVKNYSIWRNDIMEAEFLSNELEKKYGRGIIKDINYKTGEVEFYQTGYGIYSNEDRIKILAMRDYIGSNWAISPAYFEEYKKEQYAVSGKKSFIKNHPNITLDEFENFSAIFSLPIWQKIRSAVKYNVDVADIIENANKIMIIDGFEKVKQILNGSSSVDDFNIQMTNLIASYS